MIVPYMKEHLEAGVSAGLVMIGLLFLAYMKGVISSGDYILRLSTLAFIGIVIGSDLPDIDAKRAPVSKMFLIIVPATVMIVALGLLRLWLPLSLGLGAIALWAYTKHMPRHRGSLHTVRAGLVIGAITALLLVPILRDVFLCLWGGLCLALGYSSPLWWWTGGSA